MRANSSLRAREQLGGLEQDLLALVARQLRLEGLRLGEGLAHMLRPRRRHRADHRVVVGIEHLDDARRSSTCLPAMRIASWRTRRRLGLDVHGACPQAATRLSATSKTSKLRSLCPAGSVDLAVGDHRHHLLGQPAMRAQRLGQAREIVLLARWCRAPCAWSRSPRCRRCGPPAARSARRPPSRVDRQLDALDRAQLAEQRVHVGARPAGRPWRTSRARRDARHKGR